MQKISSFTMIDYGNVYFCKEDLNVVLFMQLSLLKQLDKYQFLFHKLCKYQIINKLFCDMFLSVIKRILFVFLSESNFST